MQTLREEHKDFEPYWYVYRRGCNAPTKRHDSEQQAIAEAQRVAAKEGKSFYVLKAVAKIEP